MQTELAAIRDACLVIYLLPGLEEDVLPFPDADDAMSARLREAAIAGDELFELYESFGTAVLDLESECENRLAAQDNKTVGDLHQTIADDFCGRFPILCPPDRRFGPEADLAVYQPYACFHLYEAHLLRNYAERLFELSIPSASPIPPEHVDQVNVLADHVTQNVRSVGRLLAISDATIDSIFAACAAQHGVIDSLWESYLQLAHDRLPRSAE